MYTTPEWEEYKDSIKKIVIGEGITEIGYQTFEDMEEETVVLPSTLTTIGYAAFQNNSCLKSILLSDSLVAIGDHAFYGCTFLNDLTIPGSVKDLQPVYMFWWCGKYITLGEGCEKIGHNVFDNPLAKRVWLPSTINLIQESSFSCKDTVYYGQNTYTEKYFNAKRYTYVDATKEYDLSNADIKLSYSETPYDGEEKKPEINVTYEIDGTEIPLYEGYDYSVKYSNNVEIGKTKVTIQGLGCYKGTVDKTFDIYGKIQQADVKLAQDSVLYNGTEQKPDAIVIYNGKKLTENADYEISYQNNIEEGTASVIISGKNQYKGSKTVYFKINKKSIQDATASLEYDSVTYNGEQKKPAVLVSYDGTQLKEGIDYSLTYSDNVMPGNGTVVINGIGQYKENKTMYFAINGISINDAKVTLSDTIYTYDGSEKKPTVLSVELQGKKLINGTDYKVSYKNNLNEGTGYVVIVGKGIYSGAISQSFRILPYNAGMDSIYNEGDTLISGKYVYMVTDDEQNEVELSAVSSKKVKKLIVPATVKNENGNVYRVTSIGQKAFYKNTKLTNVVIGNNVTSIENYAFYGCSKLKKITINSSSVIDVEDNAIKGISKKAIIKVPKKLIKKYKKEFNSKSGYKKTMKIRKK